MKGECRNQGMAWSEYLVIIGIVAILMIVLLPIVVRTMGIGAKGSCAKNLKEWGQVLRMYAEEDADGKLPPIQIDLAPDGKSVDAAAAPRLSAIWPQYLTNPAILVCPADADNCVERYQDDSGHWALDEKSARRRAGDSYSYLGWTLDKCNDSDPKRDIGSILEMGSLIGQTAPSDIDATLEGPAQLIEGLMGVVQLGIAEMGSGKTLGQIAEQLMEADVKVAKDPDGNALGNGGSDTIFRLRLDLRPVVAAAGGNPEDGNIQPNHIFVMFDNVANDPKKFNHPPGGSNILYLDGHVKFSRHPGKAPLSQTVTNLVANIKKD
ncbi:MAG TPA: hypothetical protein PLO37_10650 [Candidatus Hydrogenedentes bacterium]|nr:hypothetical protein [Candidatus Hydrogenedentota bacterium]HPG67295.1 hypothetical protein [Candidatus Hydrogenedentota bacterium]